MVFFVKPTDSVKALLILLCQKRCHRAFADCCFIFWFL